MKRLFVPLFLISAVVLFTTSMRGNYAQTVPPADNSSATAGEETTPDTPEITANWPLTFNSSGVTYSIFTPQCDSWNGHDFIGRSALAVQVPGQAQPIYGTIDLNAITLVDKNSRTVKLAEIKVTGASFPTARSQTQNYLAALRGLPQRVPSMPLDSVQGSLTLTPPVHTERLNNTPPVIITATRPAVLVSIDGPPVWKSVPGTSLERVINTRVLLFRDASGRVYLHLFDGYLRADSLEGGHWMVAPEIPDGAALAQEQALAAGDVDLMRGNADALTGREPSLSTSMIPDVFVATTPAELLTFSGAPDYVPISGIDLLYADNTSGNVFKLLTDQENYVLLAGRWYRAPSLNGPWQFVPGNELPRDFANIPDNSPKENVKASVPETPQAQEALIANSIPQSASVPLKQQMQNPQMDGSPQLAAIEGTPLHYVVNSETPIIEVDPQSWYAAQDGVWYFSTSVNGPWSVATSIPPVIYSIPTSSPLHYLTYVQVYGSDQNNAYEGYTPGYMGTEDSGDGTVVYGTGYYYQPWIGSVWYSSPVTWGYGFGPCWTPSFGWGFNCGFGWGCGHAGFHGWGCSPPFPCWGGFRSCHGFGFGHHGFFVPNHNGFAHTGVNLFHNDGHGMSGEFAHAFNSRTGQLAGGQMARMQNVHGGVWAANHSGGFAVRSSSMPRGTSLMPNRFSGSIGSHSFSGVVRPMNPVFRPMTPAPSVAWRGNFAMPSSGWNGGGTRSGGWFHGGGGSFQSGGGFQGGFRSGGTFQGGWGSFHGSAGGFQGGGFQSGGGFHGGGGFQGGGGFRGGGGGFQGSFGGGGFGGGGHGR